MKDNNTYIKVYFRIKAGYKWGEGMTEESSNIFHEELDNILKSVGFKIVPAKYSSACEEAVRGIESLYCHPMNVSGYVVKESIPEIESALKTAKTFECYHVDTYEEIRNYTAEEFENELYNNQVELENKFLKVFKTKRKNLFVPENALYNVKSNIAYNNDRNDLRRIESEFLQRLFNQLVEQGKLLQAKIKTGIGYRSIA